MPEKAQPRYLSVDDYRQGELYSEVRHEYVYGAVHARVGASAAQNLIAGNLFAALHAHLRGGPCRVFMADMKLLVSPHKGERFYYPDIQVCCEADDNETWYRTRPRLVVEVLSPHTEREDRSSKFYAYRRIDSLQEYVLVAQDVPRVEVYRRASNWDLEICCMGEEVRLESVGLTIGVAVIYAYADLDQGEAAG